ncbi:MAG: hypothetical protein ACRDWG_14060 [Actinomycetes bacterium]
MGRLDPEHAGGDADQPKSGLATRRLTPRPSYVRRVVFLETAATMVFTSALGVGMGLVTAYVAASQGEGDWKRPELTVFAFVASGILAALLFSALALPLLGATTRHESVRYE